MTSVSRKRVARALVTNIKKRREITHNAVRFAHLDGGIANDMSTDFGMTINGVAVAGTGNAAFDVVNPATGDVFAQAPECSREQLDAAVDSARAAFPDRRDALALW